MMKKLILLIIALFISFTSINVMAEQAACKINDFKDLYIKLQQSLNYEGKDAVFNKKSGALNLVNHPDSGNPDSYGGKVYENVLQKQYTSALRKVALLYRHVNEAPEERKPAEVEVVNFFKSIDDPSKYQLNDYKKFSQLVDQLQLSSKQAFSNKPNSQINDQDVYLLQKLLIHAYDTICRTQNYVLKKNQTADNRKAAAISIEKALGMMTESFRSNIKTLEADHEIIEINLAAREDTVNNAVQENLKQLRDWLKSQSPLCQKQIRGLTGFNNIQPCNYQKFVDSILADDSNFKNYEAILHFINTNQKHGKINPKAETGLSPEFKAQLMGLQTKKECNKDETQDEKGNCRKKDKPPVVTPPVVTPPVNNEGKQCKTKEDEQKGYIIANWKFIRSTSIILNGNNGNQGQNGIGGLNGNNGNQGQNGIGGLNRNNGNQGQNGIGGLNGNNGSQGQNGISEKSDSNSGFTCSCTGENCCSNGYELKNNTCQPIKPNNLFDIKTCNEKEHDLEKSKAEGKCVAKTPFDIKTCNEKEHDLEKSKVEGKCVAKTPFDIKTCNEKEHDLEKSKTAGKCVPKTTANEKCSPLPVGAIESLWAKNDKGQCVCSANNASCCSAGADSDSGTKSYDYKDGQCILKALPKSEQKDDKEESKRDPIFSREIKNAPTNFQPIILRDESIMIMPGQR